MKYAMAMGLVMLLASFSALAEYSDCQFYAMFAQSATFARDGKLSPKAKDLDWYLTRLGEEAPGWNIDTVRLAELRAIATYVFRHPELSSDQVFEHVLGSCLKTNRRRT